MDKKRILKQFVERTGLEPEAAADILSDACWDYVRAFKLFEDCIRTGKIKPLYPPSSSQIKVPPTTHPKPKFAGGAGSHGTPSELQEVFNRVKNSGSSTQWMDPYGEVRRPVERIVPIMIEQQGYIPARPMSELHHREPSLQTRPNSDYVMSDSKLANDNLSQISGVKLLPGRQTPGRQTLDNTGPIGMSTTVQTAYIPQSNTTKLQVLGTRGEVVSNADAHTGTTKLSVHTSGQSQTKSGVFNEPDPVPVYSKTTSESSKNSLSTMGKTLQPSGGKEETPPPKSPASSPRPLKRGISKIVENEFLVTETRNNLLHDIEEDSHDHMYTQTFILPDLTKFPADYRAFLEKDLIETSTLVSLEQAGRLNWWAEMGICQRLLPMATSGDGNCLLHAASLAMLGIHDRQLMLRKALYDTMTSKKYCQALQRRWRWQQTELNKEAGLIFSEEEWKEEWAGILKLASTNPRSLPGMRRNSSCCDSPVTKVADDVPVIYESLEEFHVFVLSHILQRAIIVVADTMLKDSQGEALAPIPFGGIYLPLECDAKSCHRTPLLLTYDAAHFSALVPMMRDGSPPDEKPSLPDAIPLVGPDLNLLPVHFIVDPGLNYSWNGNKGNGTNKLQYSYEDKLNILKKYLDVEKLLATNMDYDSDSDRKSSGSYESDDNLGCIGKEKKREGKMKDQFHSVTKQFGSLGKSMSKKLRKNFGSVGKALKSMGPDQKNGKPSIGIGITQSTKVPLTIAAMSEQEQMFVWCAKIMAGRSETHKDMIQNYLKDAKQRFLQDKEIRTARGEEIRRRSMEILPTDLHTQRILCMTPGCDMFGNPDTHYLCSKCFSEQKKQALNQERTASTLPRGKPGSPHQVQSYGKSKFYVESDPVESNMSSSVSTYPKICAKEPGKSLIDAKLDNADVTPVLKPNEVHQNGQGGERDSRSRVQSNHIRERTPSPDYDNVDYGAFRQSSAQASPKMYPKTGFVAQDRTAQQQISKTGPAPQALRQIPIQRAGVSSLDKGASGKACRTPGCAFYGNPEQDNFCSSCYRKSKQHIGSSQLTRL